MDVNIAEIAEILLAKEVQIRRLEAALIAQGLELEKLRAAANEEEKKE